MNLKSTRDGFGEAICALAKREPRLVVVTADLRSSTRVAEFARRFPERFFEVGVAEQNLIGVAAGLARAGNIVFATSFAAFSPALNWAQIRQAVCYNNLNVKIVGSHAGLATASDGATHQMLEDVALVRVLPKMKVFAPADFAQVKVVTSRLARLSGPAYLRLTRPPTVSLSQLQFPLKEKQIRSSLPQKLKTGNKLTLAGYGPILPEFLSGFTLKKLTGWEIFNCWALKPIDLKPILTSLKKTKNLLILEDHQKIGGLGSLIKEAVAESKLKIKITHLGVDDRFGHSARDFKTLWKRYIFKDIV